MSTPVILDPHTITEIAEQTARRFVELTQTKHPRGRLVDAATLADVLGVDRSYVYAHADELGAIRLGEGSKPRLRFDPQTAREAFACYASEQSHRSNPSAGAESGAASTPQRRRLPNRLPEPGSVLAVKPRRAA